MNCQKFLKSIWLVCYRVILEAYLSPQEAVSGFFHSATQFADLIEFSRLFIHEQSFQAHCLLAWSSGFEAVFVTSFPSLVLVQGYSQSFEGFKFLVSRCLLHPPNYFQISYQLKFPLFTQYLQVLSLAYFCDNRCELRHFFVYHLHQKVASSVVMSWNLLSCLLPRWFPSDCSYH